MKGMSLFRTVNGVMLIITLLATRVAKCQIPLILIVDNAIHYAIPAGGIQNITASLVRIMEVLQAFISEVLCARRNVGTVL